MWCKVPSSSGGICAFKFISGLLVGQGVVNSGVYFLHKTYRSEVYCSPALSVTQQQNDTPKSLPTVIGASQNLESGANYYGWRPMVKKTGI